MIFSEQNLTGVIIRPQMTRSALNSFIKSKK